MSWQVYVDDHLMFDLGNNRYLTSAAIVGQDGTIWAQSAAFPKVVDAEISKIVAAFEDSSELASNGLFAGGEKYMVIQGEPGAVIRGKKGSAGIIIKKTTCALVVGIYGESVAPGECSNLVEKLGDYLIEQGI